MTYVPFPNRNLETPQSLNVEVEITTVEGCIFNLNSAFTITPKFFYLPNIFSPNGDGINDDFRIFTTPSFNIQKVQVFSRWGELVSDGNSIEGWDFTIGVQKLGTGVYNILIIYDENGEEGQISSDFTLLE